MRLIRDKHRISNVSDNSKGIHKQYAREIAMKAAHLASLTVAVGLLAGCGGGSESTPNIVAKPKPVQSNGGVSKTQNGNQPNGKKSAGGVGTLTGQIIYDGTPPAAGVPTGFNPADPKTDKFCVANKEKIKDRSLLVDATTKGVKNVVIYLIDPPLNYTPQVPEQIKEFTNKDCMFSPRMMPVLVGRTVRILNEDQTSHNTHIFPKNALNEGFSELLSIGKTKDFTYGGAETVPLKVTCDIHGWMQAYHLPLNHKFFAVTDEKGQFTIPDLPAGEHRFKVWHEVPGLLEREWIVNIEGGGKTTTKTLTYGSGKFLTFTGPRPKTVVVSLPK